MPEGTEHFSLVKVATEAGQAFLAIICRIGFEAALHGVAIASLVLTIGLILSARKQKYGRPLLAVARKLALFCAILAVPGALSLLSSGHLPPVNALQLNSVGLLCFWALVTSHLCMEEMNFQWFEGKPETEEIPEALEDEPASADRAPVTTGKPL